LNVRFHTDPDGGAHIHGHKVAEFEVIEALDRPLERTTGRDDSFVAIGRTRSGRVRKIIYALARRGEGIFVITAYDLPAKQWRALQRRLKQRRRRP
jgi:hypothetical protein